MSNTRQRARAYLAGPMRGIAEYNFPAFLEAARVLRQEGFEVWSPAEHDIANGFEWAGTTGGETDLLFDLGAALAHDLKMVTEWADVIALLPGWENSTGTRAELAAADALGKRAATVRLLEGWGGTLDLRDLDFAGWFLRRWGQRIVSIPRDADLTTKPRSVDASVERDNEVRMTSDTGGQKGSKLARFDMVPPDVEWEVAEHFGKGARKYEPVNGQDNWRNGYPWSLSYAALRRHLNAFWNGEDIDAETGSKHTVAVAWHALVLSHYQNRPDLIAMYDDRPKVAEV